MLKKMIETNLIDIKYAKFKGNRYASIPVEAPSRLDRIIKKSQTGNWKKVYSSYYLSHVMRPKFFSPEIKRKIKKDIWGIIDWLVEIIKRKR